MHIKANRKKNYKKEEIESIYIIVVFELAFFFFLMHVISHLYKYRVTLSTKAQA